MTKTSLAVYIGLAFLIGIAIGSTVGNLYGQNKIQSEWNQEKADTSAKVVEESELNRGKEATHAKDSNEVSDNAQISKAKYDADIAAIGDYADDRVRQSESRAAAYSAMSKASAAEQERLAKYAAGLDKSLVEGRQLVEELRATVAERERTIHNLSEQINADRKLTDEY